MLSEQLMIIKFFILNVLRLIFKITKWSIHGKIWFWSYNTPPIKTLVLCKLFHHKIVIDNHILFLTLLLISCAIFIEQLRKLNIIYSFNVLILPRFSLRFMNFFSNFVWNFNDDILNFIFSLKALSFLTFGSRLLLILCGSCGSYEN